MTDGETRRLLPDPIARLDGLICGCGSPDLVWSWIRSFLEDPGQLRQHLEEPTWWFCAYVIGSVGLTEHGGSIAGAWLTQDGQEVLEWLHEHGPDWAETPGWVDSQGIYRSYL